MTASVRASAISAHTTVLPTRWWFEVRAVHVFDTVEGTAPAMAISRSINRPFSARWRVEVERETDGGFANWCTQTGSNEYTTDNVLPDPLTLDWWTWPRQCDLPAGRYRVDTQWSVELAPNRHRRIRVVSNTFTVRPP